MRPGTARNRPLPGRSARCLSCGSSTPGLPSWSPASGAMRRSYNRIWRRGRTAWPRHSRPCSMPSWNACEPTSCLRPKPWMNGSPRWRIASRPCWRKPRRCRRPATRPSPRCFRPGAPAERGAGHRHRAATGANARPRGSIVGGPQGRRVSAASSGSCRHRAHLAAASLSRCCKVATRSNGPNGCVTPTRSFGRSTRTRRSSMPNSAPCAPSILPSRAASPSPTSTRI